MNGTKPKSDINSSLGFGIMRSPQLIQSTTIQQVKWINISESTHPQANTIDLTVTDKALSFKKVN